MGSTLENEKVSTIDDEINHILKFTGEKSFTIVEKTSKENDDLQIESIDGNMIDMIDGVAFENDQQMTYISSGVVCSLYSNDLTSQEKLAVLSSMQSCLLYTSNKSRLYYWCKISRIWILYREEW